MLFLSRISSIKLVEILAQTMKQEFSQVMDTLVYILNE